MDRKIKVYDRLGKDITQQYIEIEYINDVSEITDLVRELGLSQSAVTYGKKTRFVQKLISDKTA